MATKKGVVYLVNNGGSYSDYGIEAAFSNKDAAKKCAKRIGGSVEERTLYDEDPKPYIVYSKECYAGAVREHQRKVEDWNDVPYQGRVTRGLGFHQWGSQYHGPAAFKPNYRFWGRDKARVHKAFDDHHAQRRAEAEGIA